MNQALHSPWKIRNEIERWLLLPWIRTVLALNGIAWGEGWRIYGVPIIQRHRDSVMQFGPCLQLRSALRSNPLGPNHPVFLVTWQAAAVLKVGADFGMTGGVICAADSITIGDRVAIGANSTLIDTDFHPLDYRRRQEHPADARTAPIVIEDDVFVGMHCLILKGVRLGQGCVIGAGSVVARDVPPGMIAAGNPAQVLKAVRR
jgi:acetyltransferase-like isoleucine patch superfamily enzyme